MSEFKSVLSGVASAISVALIIDYGKAFLTVADNITQLQSRIARLTTVCHDPVPHSCLPEEVFKCEWPAIGQNCLPGEFSYAKPTA